MERHIFSVTEVNELVKLLLDNEPMLSGICVRGEISNYKMYPSGHHYFSLKDPTGAIRCVMFKGQAMRLRFRPENGMKVLVTGRVSVFPRDGAYQLYCDTMTPEGAGDLALAFEQLKEQLYKEGLFDEAHKKPLPRFPERIAVVTSSAGAAVHDMIRILRRRYPLAKVILLPVRVQGAEAPPEIAGAIRYADKWKIGDVIIKLKAELRQFMCGVYSEFSQAERSGKDPRFAGIRQNELAAAANVSSVMVNRALKKDMELKALFDAANNPGAAYAYGRRAMK